MSNFQNLLVWQKAMDFVREMYRVTTKFPDNEKFGLISQLRRAAVSIPSNIAEGCERKTPKDFANFLTIARGSAAEIETQILLALSLNFLDKENAKKILDQIAEIKKMLFGLRAKIQK